MKVRKSAWSYGLTDAQVDALPPIGYVEVAVDPYATDQVFGPIPPLLGRQPVLALVPGGYLLYVRNGLGHLVSVGKRHVAGRTMEWADEVRS